MKSKMPKSEKEWKTCLSPEEYHILREKGTELAFTGKYYKNKKKGRVVSYTLTPQGKNVLDVAKKRFVKTFVGVSSP